MTDDLEKRVARLERALGGHFKWLNPPVDASLPGWKEALELIVLLDDPAKGTGGKL